MPLDLIARAKAAGHHTLIGGASADQTASLALQESLGFPRVGYLKVVGFKFGRWLDASSCFNTPVVAPVSLLPLPAAVPQTGGFSRSAS